MTPREMIIKYKNLKGESEDLIEKWKILTSHNADENRIQCIENEMKLLQRDKEHIATRFIEEFII